MTFGTGLFGDEIFATTDSSIPTTVETVVGVSWGIFNNTSRKVTVAYSILNSNSVSLGIQYSIVGYVDNGLGVRWTVETPIASSLGVLWSISTIGTATVHANNYCVPKEKRNKPFCV